jgi:hypothetical protein
MLNRRPAKPKTVPQIAVIRVSTNPEYRRTSGVRAPWLRYRQHPFADSAKPLRGRKIGNTGRRQGPGRREKAPGPDTRVVQAATGCWRVTSRYSPEVETLWSFAISRSMPETQARFSCGVDVFTRAHSARSAACRLKSSFAISRSMAETQPCFLLFMPNHRIINWSAYTGGRR